MEVIVDVNACARHTVVQIVHVLFSLTAEPIADLPVPQFVEEIAEVIQFCHKNTHPSAFLRGSGAIFGVQSACNSAQRGQGRRPIVVWRIAASRCETSPEGKTKDKFRR